MAAAEDLAGGAKVAGSVAVTGVETEVVVLAHPLVGTEVAPEEATVAVARAAVAKADGWEASTGVREVVVAQMAVQACTDSCDRRAGRMLLA